MKVCQNSRGRCIGIVDLLQMTIRCCVVVNRRQSLTKHLTLSKSFYHFDQRPFLNPYS